MSVNWHSDAEKKKKKVLKNSLKFSDTNAVFLIFIMGKVDVLGSDHLSIMPIKYKCKPSFAFGKSVLEQK